MRKIFLIIYFIIVSSLPVYAAKYTITNGLDFNARIKSHINPNYTSASVDTTISSFKLKEKLPKNEVDLIDISEDHDSSVMAYILNGTLFVVSDDEISLNQDCSHMFDKFVNLQSVNFENIIIGKVKKANYMFSNCKYLMNLNMDTDETLYLNEMEGMFFDCESIDNLSLFMLDTSRVKSMQSLFYNCRNLKNIFVDTHRFVTKSLSDISYMYDHCYALKTNFGRKVIELSEADKKYLTKAGNDGIEGILRDYDFDYDTYFQNDPKFPVDGVRDKVITSYYNQNKKENISYDYMQSVKYNSSAVITDENPLYNHISEFRIDKNGNRRFSEGLLSQTYAELPFLSETQAVTETFESYQPTYEPEIETIIVCVPPPETKLQIVTDTIETTIEVKVDAPNVYEYFSITDNYILTIVTIGLIVFITIGFILFGLKNRFDKD